ncbi:competence type IV pilus assembly protein ComGB [Agrilactobacillus yilanensis]|uniref:Competence type IV pilus assembly protein ComGB n=1 Tax=Agrilactobacillus yilanensis TaxID=2485997 RepID=A0ABW4JBL2_9LACO|nr:competence type IV pilus assembly protein ComGB [Agrilactobacillus yilanensis]
MKNSRTAKIKLNLNSQILFFSILAQMLENGFAIKQALKFMADFLPKEKNWICALQQRLDQGQTFAQALQYSQISQSLIDQIIIAQKHGELVTSLKQISQWLRIKNQQLTKLRNLMNYPILLVILLLGFFIVIKLKIQPQFKSFGSDYFQLPIWLSLSLSLLLILISLIAALFYLCFRRSNALVQMTLLIRLPFVGIIFRHYCSYILCSDLAIYLANGLNLSEILQSVQQLPKQSFMRQLGQSFEKELQTGQSLEKIVKRSELLPNELLTFIYRGASMQILAKEMTIYSQLLFEALLVDIHKLLLKVQPIMFIVIAVLIVLMYLQLLLPIYNMMGRI